jgi:chlorobactene glucosyltransferase
MGDTIAIEIILGFTAFALLAFGWAAWSAERRYRALTTLPPTQRPPSASVAILVPARNEAVNIARVVNSLCQQNYPNFTVTVIDDHSEDRTGNLAQANGAQVLTLATEPPLGWTGKCNACEQGVQVTESEWLLFTDADTCHAPDALRWAVAYAEDHQLDALSLLLRQECGTFWERVVLPLAYQQFFAILQSDKPAFNGQYILIRRSVYTASGGFGAVRGRVMEDVALAESLAQQGYNIALLNGHEAASVRMYQTFPALLRGMAKTAFAAARDRGWRGVLLGGLTFLGIFTVLLGMYGVLVGSWLALGGAFAIMGLNAVGLSAWLERFGVSKSYALLNLLGLAVLWGVGMVSTFRVLTGIGVRWKGRTIVESARHAPRQ